jgi:glycosyltransferase involved in cell wall biosynthesis
MDHDQKLRVAMLGPISWRTPPRHYGPWELVVSLLTEGLVERGMDVTLFATADSVTRGRLDAVCPRPCSEDSTLDPKVWECLHIAHAFERAEDFDLIHNHFDFLPLSYSSLVRTPVITTIHGFSSEGILPVYQRYNSRSHYVSISYADRHRSLDYIANVYHGIDFRQFRIAPAREDYLLFWGRIHPDKGVIEAIDFARAAGRRLVMAGIIQDRWYFEEVVKPRIDDEQVVYLGPVGPDRRAEIMGKAIALLHLINFDEPFGLSVVEAFACGTPVVARPRGSMMELLQPGLNGVFFTDDSDPVNLVEEMRALSADAIRSSAEERFGRERMVSDYLQVYRRIAGE